MPLGIVLLLVWLVLLVRYPRPMLPATAIIGVIALLIAAVAAVAQWRHERQVSQIEISIRHDPEHCEFGRPLRVEVHNQHPHCDRNELAAARKPGRVQLRSADRRSQSQNLSARRHTASRRPVAALLPGACPAQWLPRR